MEKHHHDEPARCVIARAIEQLSHRGLPDTISLLRLAMRLSDHEGRRDHKRHVLRFGIGPVTEQQAEGPEKEEDMSLSLSLTDTQDVALSVLAKNKKGNPAPLENPTWESSDPSVFAITQDPSDGQKASGSAGAAGTALVTFRADGIIGEGQSDVIGTLDVTVLSGPALTVEIVAAAPTEQP